MADPVVEELTRRGGFASWGEIVHVTSRAGLERAVAQGTVVRLARGRYALPTASRARTAAHRLSGVAAGLSAARSCGGRSTG